MQEQRYDGKYGKPENLDLLNIEEKLRDERIKRVITFPGYEENGKPSKELRRAWRRYKRNPII